MPRHADQIPLSTTCGATFREMKELGVLTNTNVAASDTIVLLKTNITTAVNALTNHGEIKPMLNGFLNAVDAAAAIGDITDALLNPLTTVDQLIALTANTNTSNLSTFLP